MKILLTLAFIYVALIVVMYGAQTFLVFPGTQLPSRPLESPARPARLALKPDGGVVLQGMLFLPEADVSAGLVIGFGGNAQDAEDLGQDLAARFLDMHVAVFHYRGFGPSTGKPSEQALLADALAIFDMLNEKLKPKAIFAYGVSLGSGVAAYLADQRALAGAFLITPYDSIEAVAKARYPWLPVGWLLKHRFPSLDFLKDNPTPIAIIAAELDEVVKPDRTDVLRAHLSNLVFDRTIGGAKHASLYGMPEYDEALNEALDALRSASKAE